jgi:hypothetical protein
MITTGRKKKSKINEPVEVSTEIKPLIRVHQPFTYSKKDILKSPRFARARLVLQTQLKDDKLYTIDEVYLIVKQYSKKEGVIA